MEVRIPKLHSGLDLEPTQADEKTKDDTGFVIFATRVPSSRDHAAGDDAAVRVGQGALFHLTRDHFLDLILQSQSYLGNLL